MNRKRKSPTGFGTVSRRTRVAYGCIVRLNFLLRTHPPGTVTYIRKRKENPVRHELNRIPPGDVRLRSHGGWMAYAPPDTYTTRALPLHLTRTPPYQRRDARQRVVARSQVGWCDCFVMLIFTIARAVPMSPRPCGRGGRLTPRGGGGDRPHCYPLPPPRAPLPRPLAPPRPPAPRLAMRPRPRRARFPRCCW